jgi:hypothetical protein
VQHLPLFATHPTLTALKTSGDYYTSVVEEMLLYEQFQKTVFMVQGLGFEVLIGEMMLIVVFWFAMLCSLVQGIMAHLFCNKIMALAVADKSGLSRNCAEAAGLPPTTLKH